MRSTVTLAGGLWYFADGHGGIEYSVLLIGASLAILLLGPGRFALDYGRGWTTHPKWGSWALAVLGIGAAVAWVVFNGTNPLGSPGNPGRRPPSSTDLTGAGSGSAVDSPPRHPADDGRKCLESIL